MKNRIACIIILLLAVVGVRAQGELEVKDVSQPNDVYSSFDNEGAVMVRCHQSIPLKFSSTMDKTAEPYKVEQEGTDNIYYIEFPTEDKMREIIKVHFGNVDQKLVNEALKAFYDIRQMRDIQKKPSTSELLAWIQALQIAGCDVTKIADEIPYMGVLLKKNQDIDTAQAYRFRR